MTAPMIRSDAMHDHRYGSEKVVLRVSQW